MYTVVEHMVIHNSLPTSQIKIRGCGHRSHVWGRKNTFSHFSRMWLSNFTIPNNLQWLASLSHAISPNTNIVSGGFNITKQNKVLIFPTRTSTRVLSGFTQSLHNSITFFHPFHMNTNETVIKCLYFLFILLASASRLDLEPTIHFSIILTTIPSSI